MAMGEENSAIATPSMAYTQVILSTRNNETKRISQKMNKCGFPFLLHRFSGMYVEWSPIRMALCPIMFGTNSKCEKSKRPGLKQAFFYLFFLKHLNPKSFNNQDAKQDSQDLMATQKAYA